MGNKKNIRRAIKRCYSIRHKHMMEVVKAKKRLKSEIGNLSEDTAFGEREDEIGKIEFEIEEREDEIGKMELEIEEREDEIGERKYEMEGREDEIEEKEDEIEEKEDEIGEGEGNYASGASDVCTDPLQTDMSDVEWTNDQVISLVTEYRNRPVLWDASHGMFRMQTAKYEAWSQMAEIFGCAITDLRKKLNSIFASHRREKGRVRSGTRSTWFLYDYLRFLPTHIENEPCSDASVSSSKKRRTTEDQPPESSEEYLEESEIIIKEEPQEHYQVQPQKVYTPPEPVRHIKRKLTKQPIQTETKNIPETVEVVKRSEVIKKKDECDSFGEYIAMSLRKHDDRTQAMIKQAINNILFEQEMKKYNTEQYTVVISNMEENPLNEADDD